jgi:SAM-dependent methyltransferase
MKTRVILFGAGNLLEQSISYLDKKRVSIVAIADNDNKKWGGMFQNIDIISPADICKYEYDLIIISNSQYYKDIEKQLHSLKFHKYISMYSISLNDKKKRVLSSCLNIYGNYKLKYYRLMEKQSFDPNFIGLWNNPYYFARKGLIKYIREYSRYISGRCMDFGCGTKPYEWLFNTDEYIGVEIEGDNKKQGIVYYDGKKLPFADEYFDSIVSSQVFEHIPNLDEIINELHRVLKTNGCMLITVPFVYPEHLTPFDFRRFTSYGLKKYLENNGFKVLEYTKSGNFIETVTQMKNVYSNEVLLNKRNAFIRNMGCLGINVSGYLASKVFPACDNLYLDNIIVVRKIG